MLLTQMEMKHSATVDVMTFTHTAASGGHQQFILRLPAMELNLTHKSKPK